MRAALLLAAHRCVIPASGFYEWKAEGRGKVPYYIHPAHDEFVAFAGLYDVWQPDGQDEVYSCTIITTDADAVVGRVHHRMPAIRLPWRCPSQRLSYELYHSLRMNRGDRPKPSDFGDLYHLHCLPYVDLATADRRMRTYMKQVSTRLRIEYEKKLFGNITELLN